MFGGVFVVQIFGYIPQAVGQGLPTPVVFVMHGVKREAEEEFRRSVPLHAQREELLPEKHAFVLLVPEFSQVQFPGRNGYNFGHVFEVMLSELCVCVCVFV